PVLIIVNILFAIYWLVKLKKQFLLSFLILVLGHFTSTSFYKFSAKNSALNDDLKILSFNIKAHDLMQTENEGFKDGYQFIKKQNPDILLFQENYLHNVDHFYFPHKYENKRSPGNRFGMMIYSKFPIVNSGSLDLDSKGNNIIFVDIVKEKDTIRIYNVHLESLRIQPNEENFGESNSEKLLKRIENAFQKQAQQVKVFQAHQKEWKGKQIIAGDFNNTGYSWVYKQMAKDKKDAFIEAGKGFGKSFDYWFPMRIDFILTDKNASIQKFKALNEVTYSDHYPIFARINW
ncbi:endonuclease/exonuclease/phosphatase family protein, partial [Polaribacter sp.]|nr:endonuclease/exonuclease/phosphatase family protein [Polaribacter sp.]